MHAASDGCLLHSETCVRRGKHLYASIFHPKCKHSDMQTCFSVEYQSSLLFSQREMLGGGGGEASRIHLDKSTSGPRRVSIGKAGVVRQDKVKALQDWKRLTIRSRTTSGRSNPTSMRPVVLERGSGSMFTIASAHFTWHGRTKGQITIQRIHMNAVFKETHPHPN